MDLVTIFGKNVRSARTKLGWTQEQLAFESGLKRTYLTEIEGGKRNPTLLVVERLATALGASAAELMQPPKP
jgi:transcriptional regulator with XRE-family HTH domain